MTICSVLKRMRFFKIKLFLLTQLIFTSFYSQNYSYKIGLLKYNGGGDWYANPTALSNLIEFCNSEIGTNINPVYDEVEVGDNITLSVYMDTLIDEMRKQYNLAIKGSSTYSPIPKLTLKPTSINCTITGFLQSTYFKYP